MNSKLYEDNKSKINKNQLEKANKSTKLAEIEEKEFENISEFEDSTLYEEKVDLVKIKRKYGY